MMKILMITSLFAPHFGGQVKFLQTLSKPLISHGYEITVLTPGVKGVPRVEIMEGITVIRRGGYFKHINRFFFFFNALFYLMFNGYKFDIYHISGDPDIAIVARILAKIFKKKTISETTLFGADDPISIKKRKSGIIRFASFKLSDAFVSLSHPITDSFKILKFSPNKIYQIPRIVDINILKPATKTEKIKIRKTLNLPLNKFIIISIGAVRYRKGFDILVEAFKIVKKSFPNMYLLIVGPTKNLGNDKIFYSNLLEFIRSNNLSRDIHFTGEVANSKIYLQASDLFFFPSRQEGFGIVMIEAMAVGLPCIVSELDGISRNDIFSEADTGIIISGYNPKDYANATMAIIKNEKLIKLYGKNARELAKKKFSLEKVTQMYIDMFNKVVYQENNK